MQFTAGETRREDFGISVLENLWNLLFWAWGPFPLFTASIFDAPVGSFVHFRFLTSPPLIVTINVDCEGALHQGSPFFFL